MKSTDKARPIILRLFQGEIVLRRDTFCIMLEDRSSKKPRFSYFPTLAQALEAVYWRRAAQAGAESPGKDVADLLHAAARLRAEARLFVQEVSP